MRKVIPFIKPDYFQGIYKTLFKEVGKYIGKYKFIDNKLHKFKEDEKVLQVQKRETSL